MAINPEWEYRAAARIKENIRSSPYTEHSLAIETGISLSTLRRRIASSVPSWTLQELGAVARALRISPNHLLSTAREDWPEAS